MKRHHPFNVLYHVILLVEGTLLLKVT